MQQIQRPHTGVVFMIPSLCGLQLYVQALESDPGASKGVSFTDALKLVIGG